MPVNGMANVEAEQYTKAKHAREAEAREAKTRAKAETKARQKADTIIVPRSNPEETMSGQPYSHTAQRGSRHFTEERDAQGISTQSLMERGLATGQIKPGDVVRVKLVRQPDGTVKHERSIARAGSQTR
jgi:protein involved in polysaccharide export with SLBB domain